MKACESCVRKLLDKVKYGPRGARSGGSASSEEMQLCSLKHERFALPKATPRRIVIVCVLVPARPESPPRLDLVQKAQATMERQISFVALRGPGDVACRFADMATTEDEHGRLASVHWTPLAEGLSHVTDCKVRGQQQAKKQRNTRKRARLATRWGST